MKIGEQYYIIDTRTTQRRGFENNIGMPFTLLRIIEEGVYDLYKGDLKKWNWEERQFVDTFQEPFLELKQI